MSNCLAIANKFGLELPPEWWLKVLKTFDDQLVIFPSQKDPVFRLGRKSRLSAGIEPSDVPGVENHPDTVVMRNHGLVPVTTVFPGAVWDARVFIHLAERDTWRMGGSEGTIAKLEEIEKKEQQAIESAQTDELVNRGTDAYASMKYRTGARVSLAHKGASVNKTKVNRVVFDQG